MNQVLCLYVTFFIKLILYNKEREKKKEDVFTQYCQQEDEFIFLNKIMVKGEELKVEKERGRDREFLSPDSQF